jgi:integrase
MARTIRHSKLDSRTSRAQLPVRNNPYWQAITRGRALGYRKGGKGGTWIAKYRSDDGARAQTLLGPADDALDAETAAVMTFAQAQAAARNWFALLDKNAGRRPEPYTVGQALNDYLANFSGKSLQKTRYTVERHLRPEFGELEVTELTTERLINYVNRLANTPSVYRKDKKGIRKPRPDKADAVRAQKANANRIFTPLRAALNRAFTMGKVPDDTAWRRVKPFAKVDAPRIRYFTSAEISRLVAAAPDWFRPLIQAALLTGARWSELFRMRVRDVDLAAGVVLFPETKSGKPRHAYLTDEGVELFRQLCGHRSGDQPIFRNQHGREFGTAHQVRPMAETCRAADVEPAGFHILRHTYGSRLAMAGVPMTVIAEALGHADERITRKHYAHLAPSYVRDAVRAGLGNLGIVDPRPGLRLVRA